MTTQRYNRALRLLLAIAVVSGCSRAPATNGASDAPAAAASAAGTPAAAAPPAEGAGKPSSSGRKIIRQAELELEVASPGTTQTAIERLAERRGGYVVSSAREIENGSAVDERIVVTVRVPEAELTAAIAEVKNLGRGTGSERISSADVTDEYIDLAARRATQRQLELQYLEILKRAVTVKDAMEVQKELQVVRAEIERMQGRQLQLEKEAAFSTLTVHLSTAVPKLAVSGTTFGGSVRRAWSDALTTSADLINGAIYLLGFFLPLFVLLVLPGGLSLWALRGAARRLAARRQRAQEVA